MNGSEMWLRLDDGFATHPKIIGLSDKAFRVHVTAMLWAAQHLTDGRLPVDSLSHATRGVVHELTSRGLWERDGDSYLVHDWGDWNPPRATVEQIRKNNVERQRRYRERRRRNGEDDAL